VHLARASLRYASKYWSRSARTCARSTPPHRCGRGAAFAEFEQAWGSQYPAIIQLWKAPESTIKNRTNVTGGTPGWKEAINALTMYYRDKITLN